MKRTRPGEGDGGEMQQQGPGGKRFNYGPAGGASGSFGGGAPGGPGGPGGFDEAQYANAVKAGQRSSPNFKTAWHQFCEMNGSQTFDPSKHPTDFVQSFFDAIGQSFLKDPVLPGTASPAVGGHGGGKGFGGKGGGGGYANGGGYGNGGGGGYASKGGDMGYGAAKGGGMGYDRGGYGSKGGAGAPSAFQGNQMVGGGSTALTKCMEMVKQGQRSSPEWKQRWIEFCQESGNGIQDPGRHDAIFIVSFVMKFGLADVVNANWANPYLVSLGELAKPLMVRTIKKGQTSDDLWRESWTAFAEGKGTGRDPNSHDAGSLMEFFDTVAIPQFSHMPYMQPYMQGTFDAEGEGVALGGAA